MIFKKLEILGFKSFSEKTELEFEPGVTAIVGPNGCGKSNVSDAIRWVLGEQSAKSLRGLSMEDVIFNGSANKEPLNLAEVSLTLSNESRLLSIDYHEVTISRRLYRSGESEYLLNKNVVRLKDIHDLLLGTGIGIESYSVIEQGKIDRVLNSKPEERRTLFEEAAGITKYKSKKKEALHKLELTENNLLRVQDIITEIKRQIGSLERQAKKAQTYRQLFDKLKDLETGIASAEYRALTDKKESLVKELERVLLDETQSGEFVGRLSDELRVSDEKRSECDELIQNQKAKMVESESAIRSSEDRIRLNEERRSELTKRTEALVLESKTSRERLEALLKDEESTRVESETIHQRIEAKQEELKVKDERLSEIKNLSSDAFKAIEHAKTDLVDNAAEQSRVKNDLNKVTAGLQVLLARLRRLLSEKEKVSEELRLADEKRLESVSQGERLSAALSALTESRKSLQSELQAAQGVLFGLELQLQTLKTEESKRRSELELFTQIQKQREGFSEGVKAVLEKFESQGSKKADLKGVLADLVDVQRGYERAVEAALESLAQVIVVEGEGELESLIGYLRSQRKGRAGFVSLEALTRLTHDSKAAVPLVHDGIIGKLIQWVSLENPRYQSFLERLLSRVYLVKDLSSAAELSLQYPEYLFVTREGDTARSGVRFAGVSEADDKLGLIGRQRKIEESKRLVEELANQVVHIMSKGDAARVACDELSASLQGVAEELPSLQMEFTDCNTQLSHREAEVKKLKDEISLLDLELSENKEEESTLKEREKAFGEKLLAFQQAETEFKNVLSSQELTLQECSREKEGLLVEAATLRTEIEGIDSRREKIDVELGRARSLVESEETRLNAFQKESIEAESRKAQLAAEIGELQVSLETIRGDIQEELEWLNQKTKERQTLIGLIQEKQSLLQKHQENLNLIKDKTHRVQMESAEVSYKRDNLVERIRTTYAVTLDLETPLTHENENRDALKQESDELKEKIQKMGPVNLVAIEEHQELKQRHDFLIQEQQDLTRAKDDLHKAILKINRTTRELFTEVFTKIQSYFEEYFKLLFGGGTAELVLLDEGDILESGIEIIARPPGKKLQSISLLSGGEKAMTAIALLFSIFKVKPSPFCILDEIDAPLDEANVDRFSRVLQEFVKGSQFIIITHNKRTMSLADVMYGVTMEQSGVSRLVSVRFQEGKKEKSEVLKVS